MIWENFLHKEVIGTMNDRRHLNKLRKTKVLGGGCILTLVILEILTPRAKGVLEAAVLFLDVPTLQGRTLLLMSFILVCRFEVQDS
jgi:hypothetical protein